MTFDELLTSYDPKDTAYRKHFRSSTQATNTQTT